MFVMKRRRNRKRPQTAPHDPALPEILRLLFDEKHSPRADQQKRTEKVENEIETIDQLDAEPNHQPAHDQRADDSPHQGAMLCQRWDAEVGEDQNENENVIDAERVLDHVAGEEFERLVRAADFPDYQIEQKRKDDPNPSALRGRPHTQFATAMLELNKI